MKLVPDWKHAWRWFSTWAFAAIAAMPFAWTSIPIELRESIPQDWLPWIAAAVAVGGFAGRLASQRSDE